MAYVMASLNKIEEHKLFFSDCYKVVKALDICYKKNAIRDENISRFKKQS